MTPWVTRLIATNVAFFFLTEFISPGLGFALAFTPATFVHEPWTMITYMFVHAGFGHIFFNMLSLWFFGPRLEQMMGGPNFIALYFVSGIFGALLSLIMSVNSPIPIVGASGAVYGVMLGYARFWPRDRIMIWGVFPLEARVMVIAMTALSLFGGGMGGLTRGDNVAHFAHLGGFVGGWLYLQWMQYHSPLEQFRRKLEPKIPSEGEALRRWRAIPREGLHPLNAEEVDRLLAKIESGGIRSLTADERTFLNRMSEQISA